MNVKTGHRAVDIAIVGGGFSAALLALMLARRGGWRCALLDIDSRSTIAELGGRSTALSLGSQRILVDLGLWPVLRDYCAPIRHIDVSQSGIAGSARLKAEEQHLPAYGYVIENTHFARVLEQALDREPGFEQAHISAESALQPEPGAMLIEDPGTGAQVYTAALAVLAGGGRRAMAAALGINSQVTDYGSLALCGEVEMADAHRSRAWERFTADGAIALLPLINADGFSPGRRMSLVWTLPQTRAVALQDQSAAERLQALAAELGPRPGAVVDMGPLRAVAVRKVIAAEQVRSNLVLLGNAAHAIHPVAGQGLNLTLRDVSELVACLHRARQRGLGPGDLAVLLDYQRCRQRDQQQVVALSDGLPRVFAQQNPLLAAARGLGLAAFDLNPSLRTMFARFGAGLSMRRSVP